MLGQTGEYSSKVARNSLFSQSFLGRAYTYSNIAFSIFVPIAVFNALAGNNTDRENIIRAFADKYVLAGIEYNVITY